SVDGSAPMSLTKATLAALDEGTGATVCADWLDSVFAVGQGPWVAKVGGIGPSDNNDSDAPEAEAEAEAEAEMKEDKEVPSAVAIATGDSDTLMPEFPCSLWVGPDSISLHLHKKLRMATLQLALGQTIHERPIPGRTLRKQLKRERQRQAKRAANKEKIAARNATYALGTESPQAPPAKAPASDSLTPTQAVEAQAQGKAETKEE
ncbi:hypothetical protein KIPB_006885, partial [Kipferlia bialata]